MTLKQARIKAGKTVLNVANALEISPQAVYKWEEGINMPTASNLVKLAELYGCTVDELLRPNVKGGEG